MRKQYLRAMAAGLVLCTIALVQDSASQLKAEDVAGARKSHCQSPEYRQFDFWIGDWDVQDPAGKPVGRNLVTREQDGCLLVEHWEGRGGSTGTSFNYWNLHDRKWHQLYLDNSGDAEAYPPMAGHLVDNKMVLLTDPAAKPLSRWTWYLISPGKVRQMAEQSTDDGKTWRTTWDSVYVARAK